MNRLGDVDASDLTPLPTIDRNTLEDTVTEKKRRNEKTGRNIKHHSFRVGDKVLVDLDGKSPFYEPVVYEITSIDGSSIKAVSPEGRTVHRHADRFKKFLI